MAVYAIGDVQGCYRELRELLERVRFNKAKDELWFAGDLVNRGPDSLAVLRFASGLGRRTKVVLGNHDLHLLATAAGHRSLRPDDTLTQVLEAPDCGELLDWLRQCPLVHWDSDLGFAMVHAGIPPQWSVRKARRLSREIEDKLREGDPGSALAKMYGNEPDEWDDALSGWRRRRYIINALTRMRYCSTSGALELKYSGPPGDQPKRYKPWFELKNRTASKTPIVFGHWATLELPREQAKRYNAIHTDTGCVWGNALTAVEIPTLKYTRVASRQPKFGSR